MSHATSARQPLTVRLGSTMTAALGLVGAFLGMSLAHWPGLVKIAGLLAVALAMAARQDWRDPQETSRRSYLVGPAALVGTVLLSVAWPALPGEQLLTVGIVAGLAVAYTVHVALVRRHHFRAGR